MALFSTAGSQAAQLCELDSVYGCVALFHCEYGRLVKVTDGVYRWEGTGQYTWRIMSIC